VVLLLASQESIQYLLVNFEERAKVRSGTSLYDDIFNSRAKKARICVCVNTMSKFNPPRRTWEPKRRTESQDSSIPITQGKH
jgi:hypothetical protein